MTKPYEIPNHNDEPSCPSCNGYNALISRVYRHIDGSPISTYAVGAVPEDVKRGYGLKCRDCAAVHPHPGTRGALPREDKEIVND